jgi:hypothetical protein
LLWGFAQGREGEKYKPNPSASSAERKIVVSATPETLFEAM